MGDLLIPKHWGIIRIINNFQSYSDYPDILQGNIKEVVEARIILRDCFIYLKRSEQKEILTAFLNGSRMDMAWASSQMTSLWYPELIPLAKERFESKPTKELGIFLIHNTSKKYILSHKQLLIEAMGYYQYLVETLPWGEDDVVNLREQPHYHLSKGEYYRVNFLYGATIDKKGIVTALFESIIDSLTFMFPPNFTDWEVADNEQPKDLFHFHMNEVINPVLFFDYLLDRTDVKLLIDTMRGLNMKKEMQIYWKWKNKIIVSLQRHSAFDNKDSLYKYIINLTKKNFPSEYSYMLSKIKDKE